MAEWLRLYTDIKNDRKLRRLPPAQRWLWITMMAIAKESPEPGRLMLTNGVPITNDDLADDASISIQDVEEGLQAFIDQRMVEVIDEVYCLINWNKRQFVSDTSTDRVKKFRSKNGETDMKRFSNVSVTPPETETETDTDTDINNNTCSPDGDLIDKKPVEKYADEFEELWSWYPRKTEKKAAYACWKARKKAGHLARDMLEAVKVYAQECAGKEERYIKHAKTFLGPNTPFVDCLNGGKVVNISGRYDKYEQDVYRG